MTREGEESKVGAMDAEEVIEVVLFSHACEGEALTMLTYEKTPYFHAAIFLQNKIQIVKVEGMVPSTMRFFP